MLDHTLVKPTATRADVIRFCEDAKKHHFCAVVVLPYWLPVAVRELEGTDVKPCTVVDFPYGADFVKTSTGTAPTGASADDICLIRRVVGPDMGVKAAGGIRTAEQAMAMFDAGANRIGTSAAVEIAEAYDPQAFLASTG